MKLYHEPPEVVWVTQNRDPFFRYLSSMIFRHMRALPGQRVLDLGCGSGRNVFLAAERGCRAVGVDRVEKAITIARRIAKSRGCGTNVRFVRADISNLPKKFFGRFDYVILMEVIEHIEDYQKAIDVAYKALKKGGTLLLTTPNDPRQWTILDDFAQHKRRFTVKEVNTALLRFQSVDLTTVGFPLHRLSLFAYNVLKTLQKKHHNPSDFRSSDIVTRLYYLIGTIVLGIDDFFPSTPWGTTIIAVAKKL